ncbi:long-chain-acyl-CoA synthetase [Nannocystaceae bacterium ST9]
MPELLRLARRTFARTASLARGAWTNFFWDPTSTDNIPRALQRWAEARPHDPFLRFEGQRWTVGAFDAEVNRHARAWRELGLGEGGKVALLLDNRPAFLFHFYALAKLGVIAALINPSLRGHALHHAIAVAEPNYALIGGEHLASIAELERLPLPRACMFVDLELEPAAARPIAIEGFPCWNQRTIGCLPLPLGTIEQLPLTEIVAYVYTSGTTGLPKPAVVKHHRLRRAADVFGGLTRMTSEDKLYCCLPLCHASASAIAVPMVIAHRGELILARRFSASQFWSECRAGEATMFIYVGELCRYLHNRPPGPDDRDHSVRAMLGNGLRDDIWPSFVERFGLERVIEFYAATEGNAETANLFNLEGTVGPLLPWKMALARWDVAAGQLHRDASGFCVRADAGEPGLLLGKIEGKNEFVGYADPGATKQKVLTDVFEKGDAWFDSGDLLRRDRLWHLHFVDRLGDTFRWKGENVSTQEVAEALNRGPGVHESTVYGVAIPGMEGRAGMAALVVDRSSWDGKAFFEHVAGVLPGYAQPRFLRLVESLTTTGTFKHKKSDLQREGFDPAKIGDSLWIRDERRRSYVALGADEFTAVEAGRWGL